MKAVPCQLKSGFGVVAVIAIALCCAISAFSQAQASSADLTGKVTDPNGAVVPGAIVKIDNPATGFTRSVSANDVGEYQVIGVPPGVYNISASASGFKTVRITDIKLTVGQRAELSIPLEIGSNDVVVDVPMDSVALVETTKSTVADTIDQEKIENLPINERSATGFALTLSTVGRDNGRPIGPAPTSGINVGGQRGRSTLVQVDGADFTDNSINAARTTVSQEAVQEYQVATNSYAPEFGRATGGIVNVVTKRGTNEFKGNVFGFLRDKSLQARNPFAPVDKPDFRRTQWGATFGGPIIKDKTHFFASYERRDRDESGYFTSDLTSNLSSSATIPVIPTLNPNQTTFTGLTAAQAAAVNNLISQGVPLLTNSSAAIRAQGAQMVCGARAYAYFASSGATTGLNGTNPLLSPNDGSACPAISPILPGAIGQRFLLSGTSVPVGTTGANGLPIAFRPLNDLQRVFPVTENTNYFSIRGDQFINENNQLSMRFGWNTNDLTGIQVESQNQSLGQNDFSRTGVQNLTDYSFSTQLNSIFGANWANEFKFSFGRRETSFTSQNTDAVAFNISGAAFIGRELFSPVQRSENRFQFADNVNWVYGSHIFKFGGDVNFVNIPSFLFELNFAGLFNFGPFDPANLNTAFAGLPVFTPIQSYGLGMPSTFIEGFGDPTGSFSNKPLAFFAQDTWRARSNLTFNYGIRYDVEFTKTIDVVGFDDPLSGISLSASDMLAAQDAMSVQQGIPTDKNNWAPRFGFSWDPFSDGKTVLRGAVGLFYDHPLLAIATNSDIADASQQQQGVWVTGSPASTSLLNSAQIFQGTVVPGTTPGVAASATYQYGRQRFDDQTFPGFGTVLPFTLPITKDFQYAYATQANFAVERQLTKDMSLSVGYIGVFAKHLPHPTDLNTPDTALQIENFRRFAGQDPVTTTAAISFSVPTVSSAQYTVVIPGMVAVNNSTGLGFVAPAVANFFRPSAPNYFLAAALSGGLVNKATLDAALTGAKTLRTAGVISPFGSVNAQASDGNSSYNALNIELKRRFANNFTFLASYTWSHSLDDSSDLQTLLLPQNVNNFRAEKSDSLFDQRQRFVFSGVLSSPSGWASSDSTWQKVFSNFTVAPIIEISSGRPFNIITNIDTNNDQSSQTDRPNVDASGLLTIPTAFSTGNLGRNRGITHSYASVDFRLTRAIRFGERYRVDLIGEVFNLFNRFNEASASPFFNDVNEFGQRDGGGRFYSISTAAYDPRQFQLGFKFTF
ncbi:MAG: carboxypeptidase regulatory-like domain-containing protein [Pyrinomonadaceae bacterium]